MSEGQIRDALETRRQLGYFTNEDADIIAEAYKQENALRETVERFAELGRVQQNRAEKAEAALVEAKSEIASLSKCLNAASKEIASQKTEHDSIMLRLGRIERGLVRLSKESCGLNLEDGE